MTDTSRREMLQRFLTENPNDPFARYGLALEYGKAGELEAALTEFNTLLELHPDYTPGYQMAGQTLIAAGRAAEARTMLEKGIANATREGNQKALSEMQQMLAEL
ncbi:MAG TPA: tetratricopeptide repeat protein [Terriglobales bacterium]|jgi:predicted Zn-dependent protease|nr:tetratricopeptide repeat protein [Terriglobales bacterium]